MKKQFLNPPAVSKPKGYTHVVTTESGKVVYVSGQVALDSKGEIVGKNDLREQAEQVYKNLNFALDTAGATFNDVVKMNIYVVDYKPEDIPIIREVRSKYLSDESPPASTLIGVQSLFLDGLLIEIEAIAKVG
jgi:enamine deaminase RidA (YjgF/YER057c/UK114 family)